MDEFLDNFYGELKEAGIENEVVDSLNEMITYKKFSKDALIDLIDGVFDGKE